MTPFDKHIFIVSCIILACVTGKPTPPSSSNLMNHQPWYNRYPYIPTTTIDYDLADFDEFANNPMDLATNSQKAVKVPDQNAETNKPAPPSPLVSPIYSTVSYAPDQFGTSTATYTEDNFKDTLVNNQNNGAANIPAGKANTVYSNLLTTNSETNTEQSRDSLMTDKLSYNAYTVSPLPNKNNKQTLALQTITTSTVKPKPANDKSDNSGLARPYISSHEEEDVLNTKDSSFTNTVVGRNRDVDNEDNEDEISQDNPGSMANNASKANNKASTSVSNNDNLHADNEDNLNRSPHNNSLYLSDTSGDGSIEHSAESLKDFKPSQFPNNNLGETTMSDHPFMNVKETDVSKEEDYNDPIKNSDETNETISVPSYMKNNNPKQTNTEIYASVEYISTEKDHSMQSDDNNLRNSKQSQTGDKETKFEYDSSDIEQKADDSLMHCFGSTASNSETCHLIQSFSIVCMLHFSDECFHVNKRTNTNKLMTSTSEYGSESSDYTATIEIPDELINNSTESKSFETHSSSSYSDLNSDSDLGSDSDLSSDSDLNSDSDLGSDSDLDTLSLDSLSASFEESTNMDEIMKLVKTICPIVCSIEGQEQTLDFYDAYGSMSDEDTDTIDSQTIVDHVDNNVLDYEDFNNDSDSSDLKDAGKVTEYDSSDEYKDKSNAATDTKSDTAEKTSTSDEPSHPKYSSESVEGVDSLTQSDEHRPSPLESLSDDTVEKQLNYYGSMYDGGNMHEDSDEPWSDSR